MHWHAQPIVLLLRGYPDDAGMSGQTCFDAAIPYPVVATVQLLGHGKANIQGLKGEESMPLTRRDYQALLNLLRDDFGVVKVMSVRHQEDTDYDTSPAPL